MSDRTGEQGYGRLRGWGTLPQNWGWLLGLGVLWIVFGSLAILLPFAATLAITLLLGAIFAAGGILQVVQGVRCRGWHGAAMHIVGGILALVLGGILLFFPLTGILSLTLFLSAFFIVTGVLKVISALQHRGLQNWAWLLFSGLLGLAIGVLIWVGWPGTAVWMLGLLVGVELIFTGWSMVMLALAARRG